VVVEDSDKPKGKNIVGTGMFFFATEDFVREAKTTLPPFAPRQVMERWKRGKKHSPFLDRKELGRHNARGLLNAWTLHYGIKAQKTMELEMPVRAKLVESFMFLCGGYRINQYLHEVYGLPEKEVMKQIGSTIWRDYTDYLKPSPQVKEFRPFLTGVTRESAMKKPVIMSPLFMFSPPLFYFSQGEQAVLEKASLGEIDKAIAPALELTIWGVDKRWQAIYAKVEKKEPSILGSSEKKNDVDFQKTRRRFLLDYLRSHPEELRPYTKA
jgi:hypothetical protein